MEIAKPFLKWAGGKKQLLNEIQKYYPFADNPNITKYAEPFVGGGAVLFDILNKFNLSEIYISDMNQDLIDTYLVVKDNCTELIELLTNIENEYLSLDQEEQETFYYSARDKFNNLRSEQKAEDITYKSALMIFLNKACFNGLFRVNQKGIFNTPFGFAKHPVTDKDNLIKVSEKLKNATIKCADFRDCKSFIDENTFVYFDPPYRPLTKSAFFTAYTQTGFNDIDQFELAILIHNIHKKGAKFLLSNSDTGDSFLETLYFLHYINKIEAKRAINKDASKRGKVSELLISNIKRKEHKNDE